MIPGYETAKISQKVSQMGLVSDQVDEVIAEYTKRVEADSRQHLLNEICEFVKSDEFTAQWNKAKGVKFGDFMESILRKKF